MPRFTVLLTACLLAALVGCATPETRIKDNPEVFEALPDDMKGQVEKGQVDIGFTEEAVLLALGKPDREYTRRTADGTTKVWSYVQIEYVTERQRVPASFRIRDARRSRRTLRDDVWVDVRSSQEYERTRIEMLNGNVVAIEHVDR